MTDRATGPYATERERVLTETLLDARALIVELRDHLRDLEPEHLAYVFGPPAAPTEDAWRIWDALMLDALDRGDPQPDVAECIVTHLAWPPSKDRYGAGGEQ